MSDAVQKNMDAVRRFLAAVNEGDTVAMCEELDANVKWRSPAIHGVSDAREFAGHEAVRQVWQDVKSTTGGHLRVILQNIEGDERGVLAEGSLSTPNGMSPIAYVMQMRDGKIVTAETFVIPGEAKMAWERRGS